MKQNREDELERAYKSRRTTMIDLELKHQLYLGTWCGSIGINKFQVHFPSRNIECNMYVGWQCYGLMHNETTQKLFANSNPKLASFNIWCLIIGLNDAFMLRDSVGAILIIEIQGNHL
jgi:hypothetical protein